MFFSVVLSASCLADSLIASVTAGSLKMRFSAFQGKHREQSENRPTRFGLARQPDSRAIENHIHRDAQSPSFFTKNPLVRRVFRFF